jgi:hydrogenase 3 maturation protease
MGVGQTLFGDDAAGVEIAKRLQALSNEHLLVIEACYVPENFTGAVRRFGPDLVLLIDAAHMDAEPGVVRWLDWRDVTGFSASSHTGPLSSLASFMSVTMGCEVWIIGIQPADLTLNAPLSAAVASAVDQVVAGIAAAAQTNVVVYSETQTR